MPVGDPFVDLPDVTQSAQPGGMDPFASLPDMAKPKESGRLGTLVRSILGDSIVNKIQNPPAGPSIIGFAKAAYEGATAPARAYQGDFSPQPEVPGQLSEADV